MQLLLGELPPDFLRLAVPVASAGVQQVVARAAVPVVITDPALAAQHNLIQAQVPLVSSSRKYSF